MEKISCAIYKNTNKGDNPKAPDYTGPASIGDDRNWRVAGWIEKDGKGDSYISCTISPKLDQGSRSSGSKPQASEETVDMLLDDPF